MKRISLLIVMMLVLSTLTNVSATEETVVNEEAIELLEETETEIEPLKLSIDEAVKKKKKNDRNTLNLLSA